MQVQGCTYDQEKTWDDPKLSPLDKLETLNNQDMKVKAELSTA